MRLRGFLAGVACGLLLVFGGRLAINRTPVADWLIAPLLMTDSSSTADAIVALGAGVVGECAPNHYAVGRALLSVRLWRERRAPFILFTGGSSRDACAVAVAMAGLAREVGVPPAQILVETFARSTLENAERSLPMLQALGVRRILLVTDRLHMRRASATFERMGFEVERSAVPIFVGHEDNVSMLRAGMREFTALLYYRLRGWLGPGVAPAVAHEREPSMTVVPMPVTNPKGPIVLLGASYAGGWTLPEIAGTPVLNRSMSGERSVDLLNRFDRDVVAERPRAVVIWGFVNDITRSEAGQVDAALARVRESYTRMVELARQHGIEPILATEVSMGPRGSWSEMFARWLGVLRGKTSYQDGVNKQLMATNRWLSEFAGREGLLVLDLNTVLGGNAALRRAEFTQDDGSHLTAQAYQALTEYAVPILERHLGTTP